MPEITAEQGKIGLEGNFIKQAFPDKSISPYVILIFIIAFFNYMFNDQAHNILLSNKLLAVFSGLLLLVVLLLLINRSLFISHSKIIYINKISAIKINLKKEGLETHLDVILSAGRHKYYIFRTLENQHEILIDYICKVNPAVRVIRDTPQA